MEKQEKGSYQGQLVERMREKDTPELLEIWEKNNRETWSDEAFGAIEFVLRERLDEIPDQGEPYETPEVGEDEIYFDAQEKRLIRIALWARYLSYIAMGFGVFVCGITLVEQFGGRNPWQEYTFIRHTVLPVTNAIDALLLGAFMFVVLQAITEGIYILLDFKDIVYDLAVDEQGNEG